MSKHGCGIVPVMPMFLRMETRLYSPIVIKYNQQLETVTDPDQDYQGLSTGQIFNSKLLAELKRELSKTVTSIYFSWTKLIIAYRCLFKSVSEKPPLRYQVPFADAEGSIIQSVITLGICSSNHYSAFLSHAAFLPSPGESVI